MKRKSIGIIIFVGVFLCALVALATAAIQACISNRVPAVSDGVVETLKTISVGEQQFQAGGYMDENNTGVGEYGFLSELSGAVHDANDQPLSLVDSSLGSSPQNGFLFTLFLPDGANTCLGDPLGKPRQGHLAGAALRRSCFVAYAYPAPAAAAPANAEANTNTKSTTNANTTDEPVAPDSTWMYAIDQSGAVYRQRFTGSAPTWNALYAGKPWQSAPAWPRFAAADPPGAP